jgi:hypothetical protein
MEQFGGARVSNEQVIRRVEEVENITKDVGEAIEYTKSIIVEAMNARGSGGGAISLPDPPEGSISAIAVKEILNTLSFDKRRIEFWTFAIIMTAAKQLEYALRELDASCVEILTRLVDAEVAGAIGSFNFYRYFSPDDLKERRHDKFVLGKTARVLFAYRALARIVTIEDN